MYDFYENFLSNYNNNIIISTVDAEDGSEKKGNYITREQLVLLTTGNIAKMLVLECE
jgi:hypothetical protein